MTSNVRGIAGALIFAKNLLDGKSTTEARAATKETMEEMAPLVDPAIAALDDVAKKRAAKKAAQRAPEEVPTWAADGAQVIDTVGEEVREPPRKKG